MIRLMQVVLMGLAMSAGLALAQDSDFQEGKDYQRLGGPGSSDDDTIQVMEFFSYYCPHCNRLASTMEAWAENAPDNVEVVHIPVIFRPNWEPGARAYYTAEALGILDKTHHDFFTAIHDRRQPMQSKEELSAFFEEHGVTKEDFERAYQSFEVDTKLRRAQKLMQQYRITGVPSLVVDGKYQTSGAMTGSNERLFDVVDYLIRQETAEAG